MAAFFADRWITITQDGTKEWPQLLRAIANPIRASTLEDAMPDADFAMQEAGIDSELQGAGPR